MRSHRRLVLTAAALVLVFVTAAAAKAVIADRDDAGRHYLGSSGWPTHGQAAYVLGAAPTRTSPDQPMVPIASLAKVMTAYLVLRAHPLTTDSAGFTFAITADDVEDTAERRGRQQSVIKIAAGERLTERQALTALLLPSANNIAVILARFVAGSEDAFVAEMNDTAYGLHMNHTRYTDPSGFDKDTRSTADDQLRLARAVMQESAFAAIVAMPSARLPVAGTVHNTDKLLGHDGFAGIKTGSMDASGGCFMFLSHRVVDGRPVDLYGVVLGQPGHNLITAALTAARQLADNASVAPV
jgi:D-alanyl-D-alanine carboxypeptidase (penicillin-binding protein 5/6)